MSATTVVDLGPAVHFSRSLPDPAGGADVGMAITSGGCVSALSGVQVGSVIDLLHANTFCNVWVQGQSLGSGPLLIGVQTSDTTTSGSFTDPTSGLARLPAPFVSGGWLVIGSGTGTNVGIFSSGVSGSIVQSGFACAAGFIRPHRYARLITGSGFYDGPLGAGFISELKTKGSGGGFTHSPHPSSVINV